MDAEKCVNAIGAAEREEPVDRESERWEGEVFLHGMIYTAIDTHLTLPLRPKGRRGMIPELSPPVHHGARVRVDAFPAAVAI